MVAVPGAGCATGNLHSGIWTGERTLRAFRGKAAGGLGLNGVLDTDASRLVVS